MSHVAQRRVAIRMLHDPAFVAAVRRDADATLASVDLTPAERRALAAVPEAAWRTDPERASRVLAALREEFPASVGLAPERADAFLSSPHFHRAVQERGSLAIAFGSFMREDPDPLTAATASLETESARVRRAPRAPAPSEAGCLRLSPRARVVHAPPAASALLDAARGDGPLPSLAPSSERVLVVRDADGSVTMEELSEELAGLLEAAVAQRPRNVLTAFAVAAGASEDEAAAILDTLVRDGILC